ncbi:MAG TPA: hypothetical protein VE990_19255 [Acidimicrobiales bacterium]|nr:hypothetical protein [Acidimicrobiales bacterium]
MTRLVRGELLKIWTTRSLLLLTLLSVAFGFLGVVTMIVSGGRAGSLGSIDPRSFATLGATAYIFAGALGVICIANEGRHNTADHTYLATPRRSRVVLAKLAATIVTSMFIGVLTEAAIFALGLPWLAAKGLHLGFGAATWWDIAGQILGIALIGALGVAVGGIIRNQVAGIIVVVAWLLIAEGALSLLLPGAGRFLPARGLVSGLAGDSSLVPRWDGAVLLLAYLAGLGGFAAWLIERRDIA